MAWCETCDAEVEVEDSSVDDVACPTCGGPTVEHRPSPWWFKFLAAATVVYLVYRAVQGTMWLIHHFGHHH